MRQWQKLGRVLAVTNHAQTPTPLVMEDRVRVYYGERDAWNKSLVSYADLDIKDPMRILEIRKNVLNRGPLGSFDADGQMPSFALRTQLQPNQVTLYYSGWSALASGAYQNSIGIALSTDGGQTFERAFDGPSMDRTPSEPYLCVTPCLTPNGQMFYIAGERWEMIEGRPEPIYDVRTAVSKNRYDWQRGFDPVLPKKSVYECFSRPWVRQDESGFHMWYSYRTAVDYRDGKNAYRIGYAFSGREDNGVLHRRDEDAGITVSPDSWDSTMICYAAVFLAGSDTYMVYNGNTFGKGGFGLAVAR